MKQKIDRYNEFITENIFYVTLTFAFWISFAIILIVCNIYLGSSQRMKIQDNTVQALRNHDRILGNDLKQDSIHNALREKLDSINKYK